MLPFTATSSENTPLVDRGADRPLLCGQCLLCVSDKFLVLTLLALFIINLVQTGGTKGVWAWLISFFVFIVADLCLGFFCLATGILMCGSFIGFIHMVPDNCLLSCCGVFAVLLHTYFLMLLLSSISFLHALETKVVLTVPVPVELLRAIWGCLWRPGWWLLYEFPLALTGSEKAASPEWFECRQIIVGSVFWFCVLTHGCVRNFLEQILSDMEASRRRTLIRVLIYMYVSWMTYSSAILTSEPLVSFGSFLLRVSRRMGYLMLGERPNMRTEEWAVAFVLVWIVARLLWLGSGLDQLQVRWKMEERLRFAMNNPFVAQLEHDFGEANLPSQALVRSVSRLLPAEGGVRMNVDSLKERQKLLLDARRQILWEVPSSFSMQVNRDSIIDTSSRNLFKASAMKLCSGRLSIMYLGEAGIDAGGVLRDWFDSLARALADGAEDLAGSSFFTLAPDQTLVPRPVKDDDEEKFRVFLSIGKFIALIVLREKPVPLSFSLAVCKCFLKVPVGMRDVHRLDPDFYRVRIEPLLGLNGVREMEELCGEPLTFMSAATDICPSKELCPGGAEKLVTEENKTEYIRLLCEEYAFGSFRREMQCMQEGFYEVLPLSVLEALAITPAELSMMISGIAEIDANDWNAHSDSGDTPIHTWFWEIVAELDNEDRCRLLHFSTGLSRLPPRGFIDLKPRFSVSVTCSGTAEHLPHAHTCTNQIVLHSYTSKEQLFEKLLQAIQAKDFGFS